LTFAVPWQVSSSVVRNLSWRADTSSKLSLREAGAATVLMQSAMMPASSEQTLKSILCALWNVSGHCMENKASICAVPGALEFLVSLLEYRSPSKSLTVVENAGLYHSLSEVIHTCKILLQTCNINTTAAAATVLRLFGFSLGQTGTRMSRYQKKYSATC